MNVLPFEEVIQDASGGNIKVQKGDYLTSGKYPIVDQGQQFVGGFSDDQSNLVKGEGPWIVFGDHTRALKFIKTPFCMGADGVKVLRLKREGSADLKYIFHFMQHSNIPSAGYSRHYKFLKRLEIPLPPLDEQRRIATILDKADQLRQKRRQAIVLLDSLTRSMFLEMFGDPVSNPKGWHVGQIGDLLESANYGTSSKAGGTGKFPILRMGNVTADGRLDVSDLKYIDLSPSERLKYTLKPGDLLFNRTNSADLVGKTAVFNQNDEFAFAGYLVRARVNQKATPEYISCYLNSAYGKAVLRGMAKSIVGMANINAKELQTISIPIPPIELQRRLSEKLKNVEEMRKKFQPLINNSEALFVSLQHRAFIEQL